MANHRGGSGNFAEDRERASEAGRKGGQSSGEKGVKIATAATSSTPG
ncbi:KGG domain-containing protein [Enterobacter hormaechei]